MIRYTILSFIVLFVSFYSFKDWYKSACGLVVLTAVLERPDIPRSMLGIPGLNPWNIAFLFVIFGWIINQKREGLKWDFPPGVTATLAFYVSIIIISYLRLIGDYSGVVEYHVLRGFQPPSSTSLLSDHIINSIKWIVPGLLLFHGCNSRSRLQFALAAIIITYTLLAIQVIKWMPLSAITAGGEGLADRSLRVLDREIGYHRVDLSMILAGASWAIFSTRSLFKGSLARQLVLLLSFVSLFGQALTGGRAGYGTWVVIGFVLSWLRWRKLLLLLPVVLLTVIVALPSVVERITEGFSSDEEQKKSPQIEYIERYDQDVDFYTVTAGRLLAWPYVIEKIAQAPFLGYGREAMQNIGISSYIFREYRDSFPHPHNAYMQLILDNGIIGALPIFIFYYLIVKYSMRLFRDKSNDLYGALGGMCIATVMSLLVASVGAQSFYPKIGVVGMWCAIGLMLRIYAEREKILRGEGSWADGVGNGSINPSEEEPKKVPKYYP